MHWFALTWSAGSFYLTGIYKKSQQLGGGGCWLLHAIYWFLASLCQTLRAIREVDYESIWQHLVQPINKDIGLWG